MLKGIIFDFDGVIVESVQIKSDAFKELYTPYGLDIAKKVVKHHEANGGMSRFEKIKYYHKTFLNVTQIEKEIKDLANRFSELVIDKVINASYVPGVFEYIQKNHGKYKLFISTGTPTKEIKQILKGRKITYCFTGVFGSPDKKSTHLKQIMNKYNLKPTELIFYGDSITDLDAAEKAHIKFVLVKNYFNEDLFQNYRGKIINDFIDLL